MLRFGIVGTGNIAHRFARAISFVPDAKLVAVASRTKEKAEFFQKEFGLCYSFDSYEAMAQSDVIDVAYIAVPHQFHKPCTLLMLKSKKHVLCEKPMAVNEKEALEMFACAKENQRFLMEAMWARFVPGTIKLLELVQSGKLGTLQEIGGDFCYALSENQLSHHVLKVENGGGSLLDVGIYGLNFSKWFFGETVKTMDAKATLWKGIDSYTEVSLTYKEGGISHLSSAVFLDKPNFGYLKGTKGKASIPHFYAPETVNIDYADGTHETITAPYKSNGFEYQIQHVCDCIQQGLLESPVITKEHTLFILKQMDAIRKQIHVHYPQDD